MHKVFAAFVSSGFGVVWCRKVPAAEGRICRMILSTAIGRLVAGIYPTCPKYDQPLLYLLSFCHIGFINPATSIFHPLSALPSLSSFVSLLCIAPLCHRSHSGVVRKLLQDPHTTESSISKIPFLTFTHSSFLCLLRVSPTFLLIFSLRFFIFTKNKR